jgi:hypothetical protein
MQHDQAGDIRRAKHMPLGSSLLRWRAMAPRQMTTDSRTKSCCGHEGQQSINAAPG